MRRILVAAMMMALARLALAHGTGTREARARAWNR